MRWIVLAYLAFSTLPHGLWGQGKKIEDFTLINVQNDQEVSLSDYRNKAGIVVIFVSHVCPYAKIYESRIKEHQQQYSSRGIQFILIQPQKTKSKSKEEMIKVARTKGFQFPYLVDKDQKVSAMFGAKKTPEAFLLKRNKRTFTVVYRGAIDDNPQMAEEVGTAYLKDAIEATLKNKTPASAYYRPTGCMIRKN